MFQSRFKQAALLIEQKLPKAKRKILLFYRLPLHTTQIFLLNVAKCNNYLGKVRIKPMLVEGLSHWGQPISPEAYVTRCGVVATARCLPFPEVALCLFSS